MYRRGVSFVTACALGMCVASCGFNGNGNNAMLPADAAAFDAAAAPDAVSPDAAEVALDTTITGGAQGDVTTGTTLTYTFSGVGGTAFECRVDTASFAPCTSPYTLVAALGAHTFAVRVVLGNRVDTTPATRSYTGIVTGTRIRLVSGNLTSGNLQAYEPPGTRIFQGLRPDIAMVQEFNVGDNSATTVRAWVDTTFGSSFFYFRESGADLANGIVSRYPIVASGVWQDTESPNREFAYARIDVPGPIDLWVVSLHLLTNDAKRPAEATQLVGYINAMVPVGDYLVIGGDFNSDTRTEPAITTLSQVVQVSAPYPVDQLGDGDTNRNRNSPYDWVMFDAQVAALQVPTTIGTSSFTNGLVFDSRVYTPLADVSPVLMSDSAAMNMQHMAVVRDIVVP